MAIDARLLAAVLAAPERAAALEDAGWATLLTMAKAERLDGTLAHRLEGQPMPDRVAEILATARANAAEDRRRALWEVEVARRALAPLGVPVVLLKGSAFIAAGLDAAIGRLTGDLDILVPRDALPPVEAALLAHGWEWLKTDDYDDFYYRTWMHELPPLIHRDRDRMIDVHHTILPLTARPTPYPLTMIDLSIELEDGLLTLRPEHMVVHAAAHLIADGDLSGGLRNLWDIDRLCREFCARQGDFFLSLAEEAALHNLYPQVNRALRLARRLFGTPLVGYRLPIRVSYEDTPSDRVYAARLSARDGWGRESRKGLRFAFYLRSHLIRMPLPLLLRHLWIKWRKARG